MSETAYKLTGVLGKGGTSLVYAVLSEKDGKTYAFKVPQRSGMQGCQKEADIQRRIRSHHVPRVKSCIWIEGHYGILMEYRSAQTLEYRMQEGKCLSETAVLRLGIDLCSILIKMHSAAVPVYYLDMKPSNILMKKDRLDALIDFGCAREIRKGEQLFAEGRGTIGYAAPEQFHRGELLGKQTDIYALGKTLLEAAEKGMMHGDTRKLLQKCIRIQKEERPESAKILQRELRKCYWNLKVQEKQVRVRAAVCAVGICFLLLLSGAGYTAIRQKRQEEAMTWFETGKKIWYEGNKTKDKIKGGSLCEKAWEYGLLTEEVQEEAGCYMALCSYYEGIDKTETAAQQFCRLAELLIRQQRVEELLEVTEELLRCLYESDDPIPKECVQLLDETEQYLKEKTESAEEMEKERMDQWMRLRIAVFDLKEREYKNER